MSNSPPLAPVDNDDAINRVIEGAAVGTAVGITAVATDPDGDPVAYSLVDDAGGRFAIDPVTGVVIVANAALIDYETDRSHAIVVQAVDANGASSMEAFNIAVADA